MLFWSNLLSLSKLLCGQARRSIHYSRVILLSGKKNENEDRKINSDIKEAKAEDRIELESVDNKTENGTIDNPTFQIPLSRRFRRRKFNISPETRFQSLFNDSSANVINEMEQNIQDHLSELEAKSKPETDKQSSNSTKKIIEDSVNEPKYLTEDSVNETTEFVCETRNSTNDTHDSTDNSIGFRDSSKDSVETKKEFIENKDSIQETKESTKEAKSNKPFRTDKKATDAKTSEYMKYHRKVKPVNRLVDMIPTDYWTNVETDTKDVIDELEDSKDDNGKKTEK